MVSQIDTRRAGMEADMARRDADAAKRETRLILAMAVIVGVYCDHAISGRKMGRPQLRHDMFGDEPFGMPAYEGRDFKPGEV